MRVWVLGSGSRGNAVLLECGESRVLVDAGFPVRELEARLSSIGVAPESLEAVIVTHEHADHVRGACAAARRWGCALYTTRGTLTACGGEMIGSSDVRVIGRGDTVPLSRLDVRAVGSQHDAAEPIVVTATAHVSGIRAGVAYDLGAVTDAVRSSFRDLDILVLEANHDEGMLNAGPYPPSVRRRIGGRLGHLSNGAAARFARDCVHAGLQEIVLAHLSESCNDRMLAVRTVATALHGTRFGGRLSAATQDGVIGPLLPHARRVVRGVQLSLPL